MRKTELQEKIFTEAIVNAFEAQKVKIDEKTAWVIYQTFLDQIPRGLYSDEIYEMEQLTLIYNQVDEIASQPYFLLDVMRFCAWDLLTSVTKTRSTMGIIGDCPYDSHSIYCQVRTKFDRLKLCLMRQELTLH